MCKFLTAGEQMMFSDLIEGHCPPLLFKGAVDDWPALKWTPQYLADVVGDKLLRCKIAERDEGEVCPETECLYIDCSLQQYCDWLNDCCKETNPLKSIDRDTYSCYVDYKYMKDMFVDCPHLLKDVKWDRFGFPDRNGSDSTIWIGSEGAYTPCHQDTYGFNLVTQIYGSKRWFLFDPSQTGYMYPTRVPYEESSIFSEVNILKPDLETHKLFKKTTPYVVVLHPGDTLYVPRHWWHFVQCTESSISVNTWIPVKEDLQSHVNESITRFLMSALIQALPGINLDTVLNPTEEVTTAETSLNYVEMALNRVKESEGHRTETQSTCNTQNGGQEDILEASRNNCNFSKFKDAFKDFRVTKLQKIGYQSSASASAINSKSLNVTHEEDFSPLKKKTKFHNHGSSDECLTNKEEMSTCRRTEIFSVQSCSFQDYVLLLDNCVNFSMEASDSEEIEHQLINIPQNCCPDSDITHENSDITSETSNITSETSDNMSETLSMSRQSSKLSKTDLHSDITSETKPIQTDLQYNIINAILNPNVIYQISKNILNKLS